MEDLKAKALEITLKHAEMALKDVMVELAFPVLKAAVEKSESKIDDMVLAALEEPMKKAVLELVDQIYKG